MIFCTVLTGLLLLTVSCSSMNQNESIINTNCTESSLAVENNITENNTADNSNYYQSVDVELPTDIKPVPTTELDLPITGNLSLFSIGDDYISYQIAEQANTDSPDMSFYKYSLSTFDITPINGVASEFNSTSGTYAICENKVYIAYDSIQNRNFCCIDFDEASVKNIKQEELNTATDSFYFTYPVSKEQYAVRWFNMEPNIPTQITNHIILCDESNVESEIFTNKINRNEIQTDYAVANKKVYELFCDKSAQKVSINTYDFAGKQLSQEFFPEVSEALKASNTAYPAYLNVFADTVSFNLFDEQSIMEDGDLFIYNLKTHTVMVFDDAMLLSNYTLNQSDNIILQHYINTKDATICELYVLNVENESIYKLADDLSLFSSTITDGKKVAFIKDDKINICDIS